MKFRHRLTAHLAIVLAVAFVWAFAVLQPSARAAGLAAVPAAMAGDSPDHLGKWTVHYQRVEGGDGEVSNQINEHLDAEAVRLVQQATWDASTKRPWTFDVVGDLRIGATTASDVFVGQYNTGEPHMPVQSVSSVVCDSRTGDLITWDSVFADKRAGLARLGDATASALAATAAPDRLQDWRRQGQFAPLDINFKAWRPTAAGIELHFPEYQFGAGLKSVIVPWADVVDLLRPELASITQG